MRKIKQLSNSFLLLCILSLVVFKVLIYLLIQHGFLGISLGGGNDADYYDSYAEGYINVAVNVWPVILRRLNDLGLYSREIISNLLFFLNLAIIPTITAKLSGLTFKENQKYYFYLFLVCLFYPTLYFFTFDIYRDVFMTLCFLIGCLVVKASLSTKNNLKFISLFLFSLAIGLFLAELRPYLGIAFISALFLWKFRFTKRKVLTLAALYLLFLFVVNYVGVLEPLTEYRLGFEEDEGGSTLGLDFSNPILFIPNFILSFLGQMLGLYITNPLAIALLLAETFPFFFMLIYVFRNIRLADNFVRFLIIFFVLYASVWLIGNDNLGTAVRLRLYNYFVIYISFFYILRLKSQSIKKLKAVNQ